MFFFGGTNGIVSLADDSNHVNELCKVGGSIKTLLFYEPGNSIIIITTSLLLVQFSIQLDKKSEPDKRVKLGIAGDPDSIFSMMIGTSLLATTSKENILRFWHLKDDDNYALRLSDLDDFV